MCCVRTNEPRRRAFLSLAASQCIRRLLVLVSTGTFGESPCSASNLMDASMKTTIFALALASAFAATALAQSVGEKTGVNSALGIAPKTEDFIKEAAASDILEIEAAKIAQQKGNADEKKFAEQSRTIPRQAPN